jgi:hypothetical protein
VARLFWAVCLPGLWSLPLVSFSWVLSIYEVWQGVRMITGAKIKTGTIPDISAIKKSTKLPNNPKRSGKK